MKVMAGKRQHFIPRFLQRGFSIERNGKYFTNWYRKDYSKNNMIIENIGLENKFYSIFDDSSVDDKMTKEETYKYSRIVNGLLEQTFDLKDRKALSEFICHMEIRTKNIRDNLIDLYAYLCEQLRSRVFDKSTLVDYFQRALISNPEKIESLIQNELKKSLIPESLHGQFKKIFFENIPLWLPDAAEGIINNFLPKFERQIISAIPETVKKVQLNVLGSTADNKVKIYESLHYSILYTQEPLILGDSIVIFEVSGERKFKSFYEKNDILRSIYLPLDSHSLLYGASNLNDKPSINGINKIIARCSVDFFISKHHSKNHDLLREEIGTNTFIVTNAYIDGILDEIIWNNLS